MLDKVQEDRLKKLQAIRELGIDPYGHRYDTAEEIGPLRARFEKWEKGEPRTEVSGSGEQAELPLKIEERGATSHGEASERSRKSEERNGEEQPAEGSTGREETDSEPSPDDSADQPTDDDATTL